MILSLVEYSIRLSTRRNSPAGFYRLTPWNTLASLSSPRTMRNHKYYITLHWNRRGGLSTIETVSFAIQFKERGETESTHVRVSTKTILAPDILNRTVTWNPSNFIRFCPQSQKWCRILPENYFLWKDSSPFRSGKFHHLLLCHVNLSPLSWIEFSSKSAP